MVCLSPATLAMLARRSYESRGHSKRRTEAPQARQRGERITGNALPSSEGMVLFTPTIATNSHYELPSDCDG